MVDVGVEPPSLIYAPHGCRGETDVDGGVQDIAVVLLFLDVGVPSSSGPVRGGGDEVISRTCIVQ